MSSRPSSECQRSGGKTGKDERQTPAVKLNQERILAELVSLAEQLGFEIREEKGDFNGGSCRVEDDKFIFLNRQHPRQKKIDILLRSLASQHFEGFYIIPAVRELLENAAKTMKNQMTMQEADEKES